MPKKPGKKPITSVIALPSNEDERDDHYDLMHWINDIRIDSRDSGGWMPKKLTQLAREAMVTLRKSVREELKSRGYKRRSLKVDD